MLLITVSCCCRHAAPQQASGLGSDQTVNLPEGASHPLADTANKPVQPPSHDVTSSSGGGDQPGSSRQPVSPSEELLDLFESIQHLQKEVVALPQPQQIPAATQRWPGSDQVLHSLARFHACTHMLTVRTGFQPCAIAIMHVCLILIVGGTRYTVAGPKGKRASSLCSAVMCSCGVQSSTSSNYGSDAVLHQQTLTSVVIMQSKRLSPSGSQTASQAETNESVQSQDAVATAAAAPSAALSGLVAAQLDVATPQLQTAVQEASSRASSSADNSLACDAKLGNTEGSQDDIGVLKSGKASPRGVNEHM